jgi:hypothetical protein
MNSLKKEIVSLKTIKEIPIRIRKKLNNNRDFLFLSEYPNASYHIMNLKFSFIQIRNDGEDPIRISKKRLKLIKEFMETECYHVDPESHDFAVSRNTNSELYSRPPTIEKYNILITHTINIYRDARPQDLDRITYLRILAAKNTQIRMAPIWNSQIKKQKQRNESAI